MSIASMRRHVLEREAFTKYVEDNYGELIDRQVRSTLGKDAMGGAQLQYMAYTNADKLGLTKKQIQDDPAIAIKAALVRNIGEIAYKEFAINRDSGLGATEQENMAIAVQKANSVINDFMIPGLEKAPREFIQQFAASDKYGNTYLNYNGKRIETTLSREDVGTAGMAFLEKIADSTLIGRWFANIAQGAGPARFTQSLRGAAIMENLAGEDPMLAKGLQSGLSLVGMAAGIAETAAVGYFTGGAALAIPGYVALKGISQNYTGSFGLREKPDFNQLAAGAAFDFATSYAGMQWGNKIVDTALASRLAPRYVQNLTKTAMFGRYVGIGVASPMVNTGVDMLIDYNTYAFMEGAGINMPQNMADMYGDLSVKSLTSAFGKRLMMQAGSGLQRALREKVFRAKTNEPGAMFGTMKYTDEQFKDLLSGTAEPPMNKVMYNVGKFFAATGYRMSPTPLRSVDAFVRANADRYTKGDKPASLIQAIMDFSRSETIRDDATGTSKDYDPTSFREMVVASILMNEGAKAESIDSAFVGTNFWTGVGAFMFGGADRQGVASAMVGSRNRSEKYSQLMTTLYDNIENYTKFVVDETNIGDFKERVAKLVTEHAGAAGSDRRDVLDSDLRHLLMTTVGTNISKTIGNTTNVSLANDIKAVIDARGRADGTDLQVTDLAKKVVDDLFVDFEEKIKEPRFSIDATYNSATLRSKEEFIRDLHGSGKYKILGAADSASKTNREALSEIFERTRIVVDEFIQESNANKELAKDPIHRYNIELRKMYTAEGLEELTRELIHNSRVQALDASGRPVYDASGAPVMEQGLSFRSIQSFQQLKTRIADAGIAAVNSRIEGILNIAQNASVSESVRESRLSAEYKRFVTVFSIIKPLMSQEQMGRVADQLDNMAKAYTDKIGSSALNDKLLFQHKRLQEFLLESIITTSLQQYRKNLLYDLAQSLSSVRNAKFDVGSFLERQKNMGMDWDEATFTRLINAMMPVGMATSMRRNADGSMADYNDKINGEDIRHNDTEFLNVLNRVLEHLDLTKESLDSSEKLYEVSRDLNFHALAITKRVLDQELVRAFGEYTNLRSINRDDPVQRDLVNLAISRANKRLRTLTGDDDLVINSVKLEGELIGGVARTKADTFDLALKIKAGENEKYKRFYENFFKVYDIQDSNLRDRLSILEDFLNGDNDTFYRNGTASNSIEVQKKGFEPVSKDAKQIVEEYDLFRDNDVITTFEYLVAATMRYNTDKADGTAPEREQFLTSILDAATVQLGNASPKLVSDLKRAAKARLISDGVRTPTSNQIAERARGALTSIAAQELRKLSSVLRSGAAFDFKAIYAMQKAVSYLEEIPGLAPRPSSIGPAISISVSLEGANLDDAAKEGLLRQMSSYGMLKALGPVGAGFDTVFVYYPRADNDVEKTKSHAISIVEDIARRALDGGDTGKTAIRYTYDSEDGSIRVWGEGDADIPEKAERANVLSYEDLVAVLAERHSARVNRLGSTRAINEANYEFLYRCAIALDSIDKGMSYQRGLEQFVPARLDRTIQGEMLNIRTAKNSVLGERLNQLEEDFNALKSLFSVKLPDTATNAIQTLLGISPAGQDGEALSKAGLMRLFGSLTNGTQAIADIAKTMSMTQQAFNQAMVHIKRITEFAVDINAAEIMLRSDAGKGGASHTDDQQKLRDDLATIFKMVDEKTSSQDAAIDTWWNRYSKTKASLTEDDLIRETILMGMTGLRAHAMGNMSTFAKRAASLMLQQLMRYSQAERMYGALVKTPGTGITLTWLPDKKGSSNTDNDGTLKVNSRTAAMMDFELGGYFNTGRKVTNNFAGSLMKIQIDIDDALEDGEMQMSVHNLKHLSAIGARSLFGANFDQSRDTYQTTLHKGLAIRFLQGFALHSPQRSAVVVSRTNKQTSINDVTFNLHNHGIDVFAAMRRANAGYPTGTARGNALNNVYKYGDEYDNLALYVPIASKTTPQFSRSWDTITRGIDNLRAYNNAIFFSDDIDGANQKFNVFRNHIMSEEELHSGDSGIFSSVGFGIKNIYDIAVARASAAASISEPVKEALRLVNNQLQASPTIPTALSEADFQRVTTTLLDYLANTGFIVKYEVEQGDQKKPLYFVNIERNGLDSPHHSGLFLLSEVRNLNYGSWFGASAEWSSRENADYDGDNALWRGVSKDMAHKMLSRVSSDLNGPQDDIGHLNAIATHERLVRRDRALALTSNFESKEVSQGPYMIQPVTHAKVFGLPFARQADILYGLMDIYDKQNDTDFFNSPRIGDIVTNLISKVEGLQFTVKPEDLLMMVRNTVNAFQRRHNDVLTFARLNKDTDIFASDYLGGMQKLAVVDDLGSYGLKDHKGIVVLATTPEGQAEKRVVIAKNDKIHSGLDVLAIVRKDGDIKTFAVDDIAEVVNHIVAKAGANDEPSTLSDATDNDKNKLYAKLTAAYKDKTDAVVKPDLLRGLRVFDGEDGLVAQMSGSGADAPKNAFQALFEKHYSKAGGNLDTERFLRDWDLAMVQARLASNIQIMDIGVAGFDFVYHGPKVGFNKEGALTVPAEQALSRSMPYVIRDLAESVLRKEDNPNMEAVLFADNVSKGKGTEYTAAQAEAHLRILRTLPEDVSSTAIQALLKVDRQISDDPTRGNTFGAMEMWNKHASNDVLNKLNPGLPIYTKDQKEYDDVGIPVSRIFDILDANLDGINSRSRLLQGVELLSTPLAIQLSDGRRSPKAGISDLVDDVYDAIKESPGSSGVTKALVKDILVNRLGLKLSDNLRPVIDSTLDPLGTGIYDSRSAKLAGDNLKSVFDLAMSRDKAKSLPVLVDNNGKEINAEALIGKMKSVMFSIEDNPVIRNVVRDINTALINSMLGTGKVSTMLANEGLTKNNGKKLANHIGGGAEWRVLTVEALDAIKGLEIRKPLDGGTLFNDYLLDKSTKMLMSTKDSPLTIGPACL